LEGMGGWRGWVPNASIASGMVLKPSAGAVAPFGFWCDILAGGVLICF
jgi:hypothetical protein